MISYASLKLSIILTAIVLLSPVSSAAKKPDINRQLRSAIAKVQKAKTPAARIGAAEHIMAITDQKDLSTVSDDTIQSLISLLDIDDDAVSMWVAAVLGDIGPRANGAVPKLVAILSISECKILDISSAATIPIALKKIGVDRPKINCQRTRSYSR